jgi:hypothetical protein
MEFFFDTIAGYEPIFGLGDLGMGCFSGTSAGATNRDTPTVDNLLDIQERIYE